MAVEKGLFAEYERCLQDEPAATTAACPLHVDVPALCRSVESDDFAAAFAELRKRVPLAGITCTLCEHPCEAVCVRSGVDAAVSIHSIERAVVAYGYAPYKPKFQLAKKKGRVAVVGGGLAGMSCAMELDRKGFTVVVYEASEKLGGRIWQYSELLESVLGAQALDSELAMPDKAGIELRFGERLDKPQVDEFCKGSEFQAVFLATGSWEEKLSANTETLQVGGSKLFIDACLCTGDGSLIAAVAGGKRAANSIERFIKKTSMTAQREREGAFATLLPYDMTGVEVAPPVVLDAATAVYTREQVQTEAARCLKCECDACVRGCAHMQKYGRKPKTYAREIYTNENVFLGTRYANTMINSCTLCGLCKERCPIDLGMAELIRQARRTMVTTEKMPPSAHDFALRDMEFSNSELFFLLRGDPRSGDQRCSDLWRGDPRSGDPHRDDSRCGDGATLGGERGAGEQSPGYLYFPGCQLAASAPGHVEQSYRWLLDNAASEVGLLLGCCGAPADWAGHDDLMEQAAQQLRKAWLKAKKPTMVMACSSCMDVFSRYLPEIATVSLWDLMSQHADKLPSAQVAPKDTLLSVHDPCAARDNSKAQKSVRSLVEAAGYELEELRYEGKDAKCCGFGGDVWFANREQADGFAKSCADDTKNAQVVYCAMCKDLISEQGSSCYHILDLLFESPATLGGAGAMQDAGGSGVRTAYPPHYKMPSLSKRQRNRAELKNRMLMEFWNESAEMPLPGSFEHDLEVSDDVAEAMEKRLILLDDIIDVIRSAEAGEVGAFKNTSDDSYLACKRRKFVTFWVRYTKLGGASSDAADGGRVEGLPGGGETFRVIEAYSHRMEIL